MDGASPRIVLRIRIRFCHHPEMEQCVSNGQTSPQPMQLAKSRRLSIAMVNACWADSPSTLSNSTLRAFIHRQRSKYPFPLQGAIGHHSPGQCRCCWTSIVERARPCSCLKEISARRYVDVITTLACVFQRIAL